MAITSLYFITRDVCSFLASIISVAIKSYFITITVVDILKNDLKSIDENANF